MTANPSHGSFADLLAQATPAQRVLCERLRELVASLHPQFTEIVWPRQKIASYGLGPKKLTEHYAYIALQPAHVNFGFYRGAHLQDPAGLLEGTGRDLRHVKVRAPAELSSPALRVLLAQAIEERRRALGAV